MFYIDLVLGGLVLLEATTNMYLGNSLVLTHTHRQFSN